MKIMRNFTTIIITIATFLLFGVAYGFDTFINEERYNLAKTVIKAKSRIIKSSIEVGIVSKDEDESHLWSTETVEFKGKLFHDYTYAERSARGPNIDKLIVKYGGDANLKSIPQQLLDEAEKKDKANEKSLLESLNKEVERVGMNSKSEGHYSLFFWVGEAEFVVTKSYKGNLNKGEKFKVKWKIPYTVTCPPAIPEGVELGWRFNEVVQEQSTVILGYGFSNYEVIEKLVINK